MFQTIRGAKKNGLLYNINEMMHEDFFDLKALSRSPGNNFSKTTENKVIKMTDIKTVKVDKRSPYTFSFKTSYSQQNYKKVVVTNKKDKMCSCPISPATSVLQEVANRRQKESWYSRPAQKKSHPQILCYFL
jgi:hypothetical protein